MVNAFVRRVRESLRFRRGFAHLIWTKPADARTSISRFRRSFRFRRGYTHLIWTAPADARQLVH